MTAGERLVTVVTTLAVPEEADPEDAAALLALAADATALRVVHTAAVEGHLPAPGATVLRGRQPRPWLVLALEEDGAVLRDLAGGTVRVSYRGLSPDPVVSESGAGE